MNNVDQTIKNRIFAQKYLRNLNANKMRNICAKMSIKLDKYTPIRLFY
jgi:hypothetical protein